MTTASVLKGLKVELIHETAMSLVFESLHTRDNYIEDKFFQVLQEHPLKNFDQNKVF